MWPKWRAIWSSEDTVSGKVCELACWYVWTNGKQKGRYAQSSTYSKKIKKHISVRHNSSSIFSKCNVYNLTHTCSPTYDVRKGWQLTCHYLRMSFVRGERSMSILLCSLVNWHVLLVRIKELQAYSVCHSILFWQLWSSSNNGSLL